MTKTLNVAWLMVVAFVLWGLFFYSSISSAVSVWYRLETFNHCFIILPVCIYLIHQRWAYIKHAQVKSNWLIALPIVLVLAIWELGALGQFLVLEHFATFLLLPLLIWMLLGNEIAKLLWFVFFFWMFSLPTGEFLVPFLQDLTADITVFFLQLTGVPVYREGLYIAVPNGLFEVAVACSGIRYLIASFSLGTLFAYLSYQSKTKRAIFVLFSLVLPLIANGIRAYGIVMIAYLSDMKYATGVDHLVYGWLFFGIVIFIMFAVGNVWAEPTPEYTSSGTARATAMPKPKLMIRLSVLALLLMASKVYFSYMSEISSVPSKNLGIENFSVTNQSLSWEPKFKNPDSVFTGGKGDTNLYLAFYGKNIQDAELINSDNKIFNDGYWSQVSSSKHPNYSVIKIVNTRGENRLLAYSYVTPEVTSSSKLKIKLSQALRAFLGQPQPGGFIALSIPVIKNSEVSQVSQLNDEMTDILELGYEKIFGHE